MNTLLEDEPPIGIGHNRPSSADLERDRVEALVATADRWARERPEITDAATAAKCADFLDQLNADAKRIEELRKTEKAPHLDAAAVVEERWRPLIRAVAACRLLLLPLRGAWLAKEQARHDAERERAREIADKAHREAQDAAKRAEAPMTLTAIIRAEEAAQRAAKAKRALAAIPERAQVRGELGGRAQSMRRVWRARIVILHAAVEHYMDRDEVRALIQRLADADARAGERNIPGVECYSEET